MKTPRILPSFLKGIRILQMIASHPEGLRLADVSQKTGLPSSNAILYMNTLISAGILIRDPQNKKFFISPSASEMFRRSGENLINRMVPFADEPMKRLHKIFNENVLLALPKESTVFFIKHISSNHIMSVRIEPEPDYPTHVTAAGRAILAFLSEKEISAYIRRASFKKFTNKTVSNEKELRAVLQTTREKGYAFNPGEFEKEVMAVAAPILIEARPIASLVVQFPVLRHTAEEAERSASQIIKETKKIESMILKETEKSG